MLRSKLGLACACGAGLAAIGVGAVLRSRHNSKRRTPHKGNESESDSAACECKSTCNDASTPVSASSSSSSSSLPPSPVQCSASSKVLLTGGYLVLDPAHSGLVAALSARFHTRIEAAEGQPNGSKCHVNGCICAPVTIWAPQRSTRMSRYQLQWISEQAAWSLQATDREQERNNFVEQSILYTLSFLSSISASLPSFAERYGRGLRIYLEGDHQFYSATPPQQENGCVPPVVPDGSKTGLGSSAALVSSLVAALFQYFGAFDGADEKESAVTLSEHTPFSQLSLQQRRTLAHNLAQLIHCSAQGKVGSGFDVSAAFFGSQRYTRFTPEVIQPLLGMASEGVKDGGLTVASIPLPTLRACLFNTDSQHGWNNRVKPFKLPPGLELVLADVAGGASTPAMVKKVLQWRKEQKAAADELWSDLSAANGRVESHLSSLARAAASDPDAYHSARLQLAAMPASQWSTALPNNDRSSPSSSASTTSIIIQHFIDLHDTFNQTRALLRSMGDAAGVGIEPPSQTKLLDATASLLGVALAGVPGAGGEDAIVALVLDSTVAKDVEAAWSTFQFDGQSNRVVKRLPVGVATETIQCKTVSRESGPWKQ